jgi:hypothetical protein
MLVPPLKRPSTRSASSAKSIIMIAFFQRRALSREIVDHREDAETAAIGERIRVRLCEAAGFREPRELADKLLLLVHGLRNERGAYGCETSASIPLDAIRRPHDTPIWKLESAFRCRSCGTRRYKPPVHMMKLTQERKITPYVWVYPDDDR